MSDATGAFWGYSRGLVDTHRTFIIFWVPDVFSSFGPILGAAELTYVCTSRLSAVPEAFIRAGPCFAHGGALFP